jgi:hypothetical protein
VARKKAANTPIMENEHVKELLSILRDNGRDTGDLLSMLRQVTSMENHLNKAVEELSAMRRELSEMREERDHPVRTALQNAAKAMETKINGMREQLAEIKAKIIESCKSAVSTFKQTGISALNGLAKFFRIKPMFEALRNNMQNSIKHDQAVVTKIEGMATQYHTAGMHLRNVGRAIRGKEAFTAVKPNGVLAKLAAAPFRAEMKCQQSALKNAENCIAALERLEKAAPVKAAKAERTAEEKPSTLDAIKEHKQRVREAERDAPAKTKTKRREAEI